MIRDILECYKIFDLPPNSPAMTIRQAYIELCHVWDPQRYLGNPVLRQQAELKRKEIDEAYALFQEFMPELSPQADEVLQKETIGQKIEWKDVEDKWSLRRFLIIATISGVLIALFCLGAICLQRMFTSVR